MSKTHLLPEKLIRIKANKIYEKRQHEGRDGNSESDWIEARKYLEKHRWKVFLWKANTPVRLLHNFWSLFGEPQSRDFALEIVKTLGIGLTAVGLLYTVWKGIQDHKQTQERLVTERFSKAVEQLGKYKDIQGKNPDIPVRVGGIYALERIAKDSDKDFWTIMEVLTSYVRENSSLPPKLKQYPKNEQERDQRQEELEKLKQVSIDVQAILTAIGRRTDPKPDRKERINLSLTNLNGANFSKFDFEDVNLNHASFSGSSLKGADFSYANLKDTILNDTNLKGANFNVADLEDANFNHANLKGANFTAANLIRANFNVADLEDANLNRANLKGASLKGANLEGAILIRPQILTFYQIKSACFWEKAIYEGVLDLDEKIIKPIKPDNEKFIKELKKDKSSDPEKPVDCSRWEK